MAKSGRRVMLLLIVVVVSSVMVQCAMAQTVHVVGDSLGWTIPTTDDDAYDNWADSRTFRVGDILIFNFTTNNHNVAEVTEASYDACTSTNMIGSLITTGPANITLTSIGEHYYICTFAGHCQSGQKLDINVIAAAPGTPTTPATPTSPTTPAAPTVHVVGDTLGWRIPTDDDAYDNWADSRTFRVGDILTFNFTTNNQDVAEVTEASYDACTSTNMIGSLITTGPANVTLTSIGEHYYICTFDRHCQSGQKLDITVIAAAPGTPTTPPTQSPPTIVPTSPTTPTPAPSQSPPTNVPTSPTTPGSMTPSPSQSPSTNGPTSPTTPWATTPTAATTPASLDSSSSFVLASLFTTFLSIAMGVFF